MSPQSSEIASVVIDSSCLIHLWKLDLIGKLTISFNRIYIPVYVQDECGRKGKVKRQLKSLIKNLHPFVQICTIESPYDAQLLYDKKLNVKATIDRGEAEVIIQAREREISTVLIEDHKGKKMAEQHTLKVQGILDILGLLKRNKIIDEIRPLIELLSKKYKYRVKKKTLEVFLSEHNES